MTAAAAAAVIDMNGIHSNADLKKKNSLFEGGEEK